MTNEVIRLERVCKTFRRPFRPAVRAIQEVSLVIRPGEVFGFVGPNGAGKSTTIKVLTGALKVDAGEAWLNGFPVADHRARVGLGYVPENPYLFDYLTPLEVVSMGIRLHGERDNVRQQAMRWLERLGIAHAANRRIRELSKGMTQRTALAHALAIRPRLLILDEPLSGLDPVGRKEVIDLLMEYRSEGGSLFFSSHVLYDVERVADKVVFIHKGEIRRICTPTELAMSSGLIVRSVGGQACEGQREEAAKRWVMEVAQSELVQRVGQMVENGQTIMEVRPRMSLESAYLELVSQ